MSKAILYPYEFGEHALTLTCEPLGIEWELTPSGDVLLLEDLPAESQLELAVRIAFDPSLIRRIIPSDETPWTDCKAYVLVRSVRSHLRTAFALERDGDAYSATIRLPAVALASELTAIPAIVRQHAAPARLPFGTHKGAHLADGRPIKVIIEPSPAPPGGYLDLEFEDFRQSASHIRKTHPNNLFGVDLSGDFPKLWLNSAIPNLELVLRTRARRGGQARIRKAVNQAIALQVWTSLLASASGSLATALTGGYEGQEALEALPEWQRRILMFWSPRIYEELGDRDQSLAQLTIDVLTPEGAALVQERTTAAVQSWLGLQDSFNGLIRLVTQEAV